MFSLRNSILKNGNVERFSFKYQHKDHLEKLKGDTGVRSGEKEWSFLAFLGCWTRTICVTHNATAIRKER